MVTLEDQAQARKAKLAALKKRKQRHDAGEPAEDGVDGAAADAESEVFRFRNYDPETGQARKHQRTEDDDTVEARVEGMAEAVLAEDARRRAEELDLTTIQPKKANWDLRRDLDRKLAKLRGKTDFAIAQLIRQRLKAEKGEDVAANLATSMPSAAEGTTASRADDDDDDDLSDEDRA